MGFSLKILQSWLAYNLVSVDKVQTALNWSYTMLKLQITHTQVSFLPFLDCTYPLLAQAIAVYRVFLLATTIRPYMHLSCPQANEPHGIGQAVISVLCILVFPLLRSVGLAMGLSYVKSFVNHV